MSMNDVELGGSNFSKVEGKKDATRIKMVTMRMVSMMHAIALSQNPANPGRGGKAVSSGIAEITAGGCVLWGTYTGPI